MSGLKPLGAEGLIGPFEGPLNIKGLEFMKEMHKGSKLALFTTNLVREMHKCMMQRLQSLGHWQLM